MTAPYSYAFQSGTLLANRVIAKGKLVLKKKENNKTTQQQQKAILKSFMKRKELRAALFYFNNW